MTHHGSLKNRREDARPTQTEAETVSVKKKKKNIEGGKK